MLAFVFGYFAFRSRIKGVYFSIITQALTYAFMLLFFRNDTGFGGNNGFTDFKRILGYPIAAPGTRMALFAATGVALLGALLLARCIVTSKLGRVLTAIRDAESRVMFCGYSPLHYKLFVWTLSAILCGIAGALYVPQVGIINPSEMSPANSIEIAIWAAVGGRGTLDRARSSARSSSTAPRAGSRKRVAGILAVLPRPAVHPGHAVPAARRDRPSLRRRAMRRAGAQCMPGQRSGEPQAWHTSDTAHRRQRLGRARAGGHADRRRRRRHDARSRSFISTGSRSASTASRRLNDLSLTIEDGELRCIIGPNGAGKTTMMDVITGKTRPGRRHRILRADDRSRRS